MKPEDIDWSKAPEGATHYDLNYGYFCNESGWWDHAGEWQEASCQKGWGDPTRYIPRSTTQPLSQQVTLEDVFRIINSGKSINMWLCDDGIHAKIYRPNKTIEHILVGEEVIEKALTEHHDKVDKYEALKVKYEKLQSELDNVKREIEEALK